MKLIHIVQIILAILLTIAVLLQSQGTGLGAGFGGNSDSYHTKRGAEKMIFIGTIIVAVLFTIVSIAALI